MRLGSRLAALLLVSLSASASTLIENAPDLVILGRIATMEKDQPWAEALAISGSRITYVGPAAGVPKGAARTLQVSRGIVLPGLVDAHAHLLGLGFAVEGLDLTGTSSYQQILDLVKARDAELPPGRWLIGRGWDQNDWPGKAFPHRKPLDAICPTRPVLLERVDGHAILVNGAALRSSGITDKTPDPAGGKILRDPDGQPTGVLIDNAAALVLIPELTLDDRMRALRTACKLAAEAGLTSVHDMGNDRGTLEAFVKLAELGQLPIRVYALAAAGTSAHEDLLASGPRLNLGVDGKLNIRGVKIYADGALGSRGAALDAPYSDDPDNSGLLVTAPELLCQQVQKSTAAGLQVAVHAIGDRGNRIVLDCLESLAKDKAPVRPRLEHAQILRPEDISRLARLGVIASMQPTHATSDMPWAEDRVGPQRILGAYAWHSLLEAGAVLAFGSDFPVESHKPILGLYAAMTRQDAQGNPAGGWYPQQKLTPEETVRAFTAGAAYASFQESQLGTLRVGALADLTILDVDPFQQPASSLLSAQVLWTIVNGQIVHQSAP